MTTTIINSTNNNVTNLFSNTSQIAEDETSTESLWVMFILGVLTTVLILWFLKLFVLAFSQHERLLQDDFNANQNFLGRIIDNILNFFQILAFRFSFESDNRERKTKEQLFNNMGYGLNKSAILGKDIFIRHTKDNVRTQALMTKQEILLENIGKFLSAPKKVIVSHHQGLMDLLETLRHVIRDKTDFETLQKPQFFDDTLSETSTGDFGRKSCSMDFNFQDSLKKSDSAKYDRRIQKWMQETISRPQKTIRNEHNQLKKRLSHKERDSDKLHLGPIASHSSSNLFSGSVRATTLSNMMDQSNAPAQNASPYLRTMAMGMKIDLQRPGLLQKIMKLNFDVLEVERFFQGLRINNLQNSNAQSFAPQKSKSEKPESENTTGSFSVKFVPHSNSTGELEKSDSERSQTFEAVQKNNTENLVDDVTSMCVFVFEHFGFRKTIWGDDMALFFFFFNKNVFETQNCKAFVFFFF